MKVVPVMEVLVLFSVEEVTVVVDVAQWYGRNG